MSALSLRLAGPMQSWGASSRFTRRGTEDAPTKSGIVGLLAAAQGRRRSDPIQDLAAIRLGVRIDQPGQMLRDFQTAQKPGEKNTSISTRYYLADAVFLVVIEADRALLSGMAEALRNPVYPLSLGRRSCVPVGPLVLDISDHDIDSALSTTPWIAAPFQQRKSREQSVQLPTITDCAFGTPGAEVLRDQPISFDPTRREFGWRSVLRGHVSATNPMAPPPVSVAAHEPMSALEFPCT